jgi:hypothetical protein
MQTPASPGEVAKRDHSGNRRCSYSASGATGEFFGIIAFSASATSGANGASSGAIRGFGTLMLHPSQ